MIVLTLKERPPSRSRQKLFRPTSSANLSHDAVRALPVFLGKHQYRVDDFFEVEGEASDDAGDPRRCRQRQMDRPRHDPGPITIDGNAGMHLGAYMKGGTIEVSGNASDWVGAEMTGGLIHIRGNAGGQIGAAYRGSPKGMRDGTILIEGSAGIEVGMRMRRGIIAVAGPVRDFAGLQMKGGTIFLLSGAEIRTGAWMIRGTIVSLDSQSACCRHFRTMASIIQSS